MISKTEIAEAGNLTVVAPQLIVVLMPDGTLATEIPGPSGARRKLPLKPGQVEATIIEILRGKLAQHIAVGDDGSPTSHQVRHWERHPHIVNGVTIRQDAEGLPLWADPMCPFCIAEGHIKPQQKPKKPKLERVEAVRLGLSARGYAERSPGKWFAPPSRNGAEAVLVTERGTVSGAMRGRWSRDATAALIEDGYIEATRLGKGKVETLLRRDGIMVRTVPKAALASIRTKDNKAKDGTGRKPARRKLDVEIRI